MGPVLVLYGSETGNARSLAASFAARARAQGLAVDLADLAGYRPRAFEREETVVIVTSTHGDGTPPEPAARFFELLRGPTAPAALPNLHFAVLGLGDSTYEHFCQAAKDVDGRLAELGAHRMLPRVDCDLDYDRPAADWFDRLLPIIGARAGAVRSSSPPAAVSDGARVYDRSHPASATVLESLQITGRGSSKETRHVALGLDSLGLRFTPGDALGLCVENDPALVRQLLEAFGATGDEPVPIDGKFMLFSEALTRRLEIAWLTPRFLQAWAAASGAPELARLLQPQASDARQRFLREHHVLDLVRAHPAPGVAPDAIVKMLRGLTPRLYSIASSLDAVPDEVHLTIAVVRYALHGRACSGVATGHIADRIQEGDRLPVYVQANPDFKLPEDPHAPALMIGAGTGVAPYRAFLQQRQVSAASGPNWLLFGERKFRTDFLYQTEWQAFLRQKTLDRITLAFSRDQPDKIYVQHRLHEHARDVYAWLESGAHVYVCGDAHALAPAVHEALLGIVQQQSGRSREHAVEYVQALQETRRYQRDVY